MVAGLGWASRFLPSHFCEHRVYFGFGGRSLRRRLWVAGQSKQQHSARNSQRELATRVIDNNNIAKSERQANRANRHE